MTTSTEKLLVSLALSEPSVLGEANLPCAAFADPLLGRIWGAIADAEEFDPSTLAPKVGVTPAALLAIEGYALDCGAMPESAREHAAAVRDAYVLRMARGVAKTILRAESGAQAVQQGLAALEMIDAGNAEPGGAIQNELNGYLDDYEAAQLDRGAEALRYVATGIGRLDEILHGGLRMGAVHVIAALTNVGKSSLALTIASHAARQGRSVDVWSLEDDRRAATQRLMCIAAKGLKGGEVQRYRAHHMDIAKAVKEYSAAKLRIYDRAPQSQEAWLMQARQLASKHSTELIIVDYIQVAPSHGEGIYDRISSVSKACFRLARDTGAAVLAVSQRNAGADPNRSIKGSSDVAEDAFSVMVMERKDRYDHQCDLDHRGEYLPIPAIELHVTKHKAGERGRRILLHFDAPRTAFAEADFELIKRYQQGAETAPSARAPMETT